MVTIILMVTNIIDRVTDDTDWVNKHARVRVTLTRDTDRVTNMTDESLIITDVVTFVLMVLNIIDRVTKHARVRVTDNY